jgi:hypothetical protein
MSQPRKVPALQTIRIPVIDMDDTMITSCKEDRHSGGNRILSKALLDYIIQQGYKVFYVCTYRCKRNMAQALAPASLAAMREKNDDFKVTDMLTHAVVEEFSRESGATCLAVSTLEDIHFLHDDPIQQCGYGFKNYIQPFEIAFIDLTQNNPNATVADISPAFQGIKTCGVKLPRYVN